MSDVLRSPLPGMLCGLMFCTFAGCNSEPEVPTEPATTVTAEPESAAGATEVQPASEESPPSLEIQKEGDAFTIRVPEQERQMNPIGAGMIESLSEEGELKLTDWQSRSSSEPEQEKAYFVVSVVSQETRGYLTKGTFSKSPLDGRTTLKLAKKYAEFEQPVPVVVFRPLGVTDEFMERFVGVVNLGGVDSDSAHPSARQQAQVSQSRNNLKQIALALHNFHDVNGSFPPAIIYGPDNKPWHSWRVLILPFLDMADIYDQYDFTQPWNSDANKGVVERVVPVYSDPLRGENEEGYTHYAAFTGKDGVLTSTGFDGTEEDLKEALKSGSRFQEIKDGTSNTVAVVSVSPEKKISWAEPRDIDTTKGIPAIGSAEGFDTIEVGGKPVVLAMFCDGSVQSLAAGQLNPEHLKKLITPSGAEIIEDVATVEVAKKTSTYLTITADGENSSAKMERVEE